MLKLANTQGVSGHKDILISGDTVIDTTTGLATFFDANGQWVLPAFVNAHCHPDKTSWGQSWHSRQAAHGVDALMAVEQEFRDGLTLSVAERSKILFDQMAASGTRAARAHVDVTPESGLANLDGVLSAMSTLPGHFTVQTVAFPQHGVLSAPGTAQLLENALDDGADLLGGLDPAGVDGDLEGQLRVLFDIAERHHVGLDFHLHDRGPIGLAEIRAIVSRSATHAMKGKITLSHVFSLGECDELQLREIADMLHEQDIAVVTCALGALPVVPIRILQEHGVRVGLGTDGMRDSWTPFGSPDMLDRAHLLAYRTSARTDADLRNCWDVASNGGAKVMGLPESGTEVGDRASYVLFPGENVQQILVDRAQARTLVAGEEVHARPHDRKR